MTIAELMRRAAGQGPARISVAAAHDPDVLSAVCAARRQGLAEPILVGDCGRIMELLCGMGEEPGRFELIPAQTEADCAKAAVALVTAGRANLLMKGQMGTASLLRAVIDKETGIRTGRLISHVMFYEPPEHKLMALTDGGMNPFPNLEQKAEILENAAMTMQLLGYSSLYAACVCGAEVVNPKIVSMTDAEALTNMKERWRPYNMEVYGPVGLDLAVSAEACRHKGYRAPGAGEADILLVPSYEVGNALGKAMSIFGGAKNAGIVVGARAPIVLVSRSDSAETKLASIALSALVARAQQQKEA